jgi:hypothetical protein
MDTTKEAMKIATGLLDLVMSENPKRGEKCKVDVDGGGEPEVMKNAFDHEICGEAQFGMSRFVDAGEGRDRQPLGQWIYTVTVKAEYVRFEELNHTR